MGHVRILYGVCMGLEFFSRWLAKMRDAGGSIELLVPNCECDGKFSMFS